MIRILSVIVISSIFCQDEKQPNPWPQKFKQSFVEKMTYPLVGSGNTQGDFYYNYETKQYRVDRENGKWDRYCGSVYKFKDTPCSHYVVDGRRYLYFREKKDCCYCCDEAHGCGILNSNWMMSGEYKGTQSENSVDYDVWDIKGLQSNLYWQGKQSGRVYKIDQQPDDTQTFIPNTFQTDFDNSVFDLPNECKNASNCSWFSVCTALRS